MKTSAPTLTAAALATLAVAAPADAEEEQRHLPNYRVSDVSALYEDVFVTRQASSHSYAIARLEDGRASWLNIRASRDSYVTDVGTDRRGDHVVVYSRADRKGDHDVYEYHLGTGRERKLPGSTRGADERYPSIWGGEVVFLRTDAGKRNGIYRRAAYGPDAGKDIRLLKTSSARSTDIEDDEISFEANGKLFLIRENSPLPRAAEAKGLVPGSSSIAGGYVTYLRREANGGRSVFRSLVDGTATDFRRTSAPADATHLAVAGPRLFYIRAGQKGVTEVTGSEWAAE